MYRMAVTLLGVVFFMNGSLFSQCIPPVNSFISGTTDTCINAPDVLYIFNGTDTTLYAWSITGGVINSGQGTDSVYINWGNEGGTKDLQVIADHGCDIDTQQIAVNLHPWSSDITGDSITYHNATNTYSVTSQSGYFYSWLVSGGTIISGDGTSSITVNWTTPGTGQVSVVATHTGCVMDAPVQVKEISIYDGFFTIASGSWSNSATWAGGTIPGATDNAIIRSGHDVTLPGDRTIHNFEIEEGASLNHVNENRELTVNGNYTVNGTHLIPSGNRDNDVLYLDGIDGIIDGTGTIENGGEIHIRGGNKTIASTADLSFSTGTFNINANIVVTNNGSISIEGRLVGGNENTRWINAENSSLTAGGDNNFAILNNGVLEASATGNTIHYTRAGTQTIKQSLNSEYYNLIIGGSDIKSLNFDISILGDLNIIGTLNTNNTINLAGSWSSSGLLTGTAPVILDGSNDQYLTNPTGESWNKLTISKPSGDLILNDDLRVLDTLFMQGGSIIGNENVLTLGTGVSGPGVLVHSTGFIEGNFQRWLTNTGVTYDFPLALSNNDRSIQIEFTNLNAGLLSASFISSDPGNDGFPLDDAGTPVYNTLKEGYWSLERKEGLSSTDFNLRVNAQNFNSFALIPETRMVTRTNPGSNWELRGTHAAGAGYTIIRNNVDLLSAEFAAADTSSCSSPETGEISGNDDFCTSQTGALFWVPNTPGSNFTWSVDGGTITSGQGSNIITVNWGATGMTGTVEVTEDNDCSSGALVSKPVNIHPLPVSGIEGSTSVGTGVSGMVYQVDERAGYTYTWSVTGGTITSGQGNETITVDWGTSGTGSVSVFANYSSCMGSSPVETMEVTIYDIITSVLSGAWNSTSTWDCNCIPSATNSVVVASGHTVTLAGDITVNNLAIEAGGILNNVNENRELTVTGDYTVNGTHILPSGNIDNDVMYLTGVNSIIDGTGSIQNGGEIHIRTGNKIIQATADLTFSTGSFNINSNMIVTNYGSVTINGRIYGGNANTRWINAENSTLNAGGDNNYAILNNGELEASAEGNTINYIRAGTQNIKVPGNNTYYHLSLSGSNVKTLSTDVMIRGDLSISSVWNAAGNEVEAGGNWINTGVINNMNKVTFNGTSDQQITNPSGENFMNLVVDKSSGDLILNNDIYVSDTLFMLNGDINAADNTVSLGSGALSTGYLDYNSGMIVGNFRRWVNQTGITYFYPIGRSDAYVPANIFFNDLNPGTVEIDFVEDAPGNAGLPLLDATDPVVNTFNEGYWRILRDNSASSNNYDIELTGNGFTSFTIDPSTRLVTRVNSGSNWFVDGTHVAASGNTAKRTGLSTLSAEICFADTTSCEAPVTSAISGNQDACAGSSGNNYWVSNTTGSVYTWQVDGGTIASGNGVNNVMIDWGTTGGTYSLSVTEDNGCSEGYPVSLDINVHPLPITDIIGNTLVASNDSNQVYSVEDIPGYTYNWTISGGTIASGQGTSSVIVHWGSSGEGYLSAERTYTTCGLTSEIFTLEVTIYSVITSVASGAWNNTSTWDCGCVPSSSSSVTVSSGHTVTLAGDVTLENLIIESGATLNNVNENREITITGNYTVNGTHILPGGDINNDVMYLTGIDAVIDGTGVIENGGEIHISTANKIIAPSANLTFSTGSFNINSNMVVTNYGNITIHGRIYGGNANSRWINAENSRLSACGDNNYAILNNGELDASASNNTISYIRSGTQNIKIPLNGTYYHLTIGGSDTKSLISDMTIEGDLYISSIIDAGGYQVDIKGNWTNNGSYLANDNRTRFSGDSDQTISNPLGEYFEMLEVIKTSGDLVLAGEVNIKDTLVLTSGNVDASSGKMIIGTSASNTAAIKRSSGHIIGTIERWITASGTGYLFPAGDDDHYRPVTVNFSDLNPGSLTIDFVSATPGTSGLPVADGADTLRNTFNDGYWQFTKANSLSSSNYTVHLSGNGFTGFTIDDNTRILTRVNADNPWTANGNHGGRSGTEISRTGIDMLSADLVFADITDCTPPSTPAINGITERVINTSNSMYYLEGDAGSTYEWEVTGGTVSGGQGSDSVAINWGSTGMMAEISVTEDNGCTSGAPVRLEVNLHPLPVSGISGNTSVAAGMTGAGYSVESNTLYSYTWSVSGGTIRSGQGTSSITVDWGTAGTGNITVQPVHTSSGLNSEEASLDVTIYSVITSVQSGAWNDNTTWDCNCNPSSLSSIVIENGHTVTLAGDVTVNNLTINAGGVLNNINENREITISGNYIVNGTHVMPSGDINNDVMYLTGTDVIIDGTGVVENGGEVHISTGNKTVASTADIKFSTGSFNINNNIVLTNNGTITIAGRIYGGNSNSGWINAAGATLNAGGDNNYAILNNGILDASSYNNTINYARAGTQNIKIPEGNTYYHLSVTGSDNKSLLSNTKVLGDLSISGILNAGNYDIDVGGDWSNSGTFNKGSNIVIFNGSTDQTITNSSGESFQDLTIDKTGGSLVLNSDATVAGTLTMSQGDIHSSTSVLTLGTGLADTGTLTRISGKVTGRFERWVDGTGNVFFPVGSNSDYCPANVNLNILTNGSLVCRFVDDFPGTDGLPLSDNGFDVNNIHGDGYWELTAQNGLSATDYHLNLTANGFASFPINATTRLLKRINETSSWVTDGNHVDASGNEIQREGMSGFGQYGVGDTAICTAPVTSDITGSNSVCRNTMNIPYSVNNTPGSACYWEITGGTLASGQGTSSVLVNWGSLGTVGQVKVTETNNCTSGQSISLDVDIHPLPISSITGDAVVAAGTSGVEYSVTDEGGYFYTWAVNGGTIVSGQGTSSVVVDWGSTSGSGQVSVSGTSYLCGSATDEVDLDVTIYDIITSIQDGAWNNSSTWDCNCNPPATSSIVIATGHTVTLSGDVTVNNLTIEAGATLNNVNENREITINGDYEVNGTHILPSGDINNDVMYLDGADVMISGTGTIQNGGEIHIRNGNKTVPANANLHFSTGSFNVNNNIMVTNYGNITIEGRLYGGNSNTRWVNAENSYLSAGGDNNYAILNNGVLVASAQGNTIEYSRAGTQNIKIPDNASYYHLIISGSNTKTLNGDIKIKGDLTISGILNSANNDIEISGDWNNSGTFNEGTGNVTFSGNNSQQISNTSGETFYDFTTDKSSGRVKLENDVTITHNLNLKLGNISAGSNVLTLGTGTGNVGNLNYLSGHIIGQFERWIGSTGTYLFAVGSVDDYNPLSVTLNNLNAGSLIAEFVASSPGIDGLPLSEASLLYSNIHNEGYWKLTPQNSLSSLDYDLGLTANGFAGFPIVDVSRVMKRSSSGLDWEFDGTHSDASGNTVFRNTLSGFGEFGIGDTSTCSLPVTSAISGSISSCKNTGDLVYSVINTPGSTYNWDVTGGSVISGNGTNSVTINWGDEDEGVLRVTESNGCSNGSPVALSVDLHPLATSAISGKYNVASGDTSIVYSVTPRTGYTYDWVVTGGTLVSGQGTNTITVDWGTGPSGSITVTGQYVCGDADPVSLNVTLYEVITSVSSGSYNNNSTWDCNCTPNSTSSIVIANGHNVTLSGDVTVNNIYIAAGGILDHVNENRELTVNGDYTVNGTHILPSGDINNDVLYLDGADAVIDGLGTIQNGGEIHFRTGNKIIASGADLTFSTGSININNDIRVTNNGTVTIPGRLYGGNGNTRWVNASNSTLNAGGDGGYAILNNGILDASASNNTINYYRAGNQNIKTPANGFYYNLMISGTNTKALQGNIVVKNDLNISSTLNANANTIEMEGDWINTGTFNEGSGKVLFKGNREQKITNTSGETFYNLELNKTGGKVMLNNNIIISNILTMLDGLIDAQVNRLIVGTGTGVPGSLSYTDGFVTGEYQKWIPGGTANAIFPVGIADYARLANISFNTVTGGSLIAEFIEATPTNNGLPFADGAITVYNAFTDGYWAITAADGLSSTDYDLNLTGNGFTSFELKDVTRILKRNTPGDPWTFDGSHTDATGYTAKRSGMNGFGEFALGDSTNCTIPSTSAISGSTSTCGGADNEMYTVSGDAGSTFSWTVTNGTIASGQGNDTVYVHWNSFADIGSLRVVEDNGCATGTPVNLDVTLGDVPNASATITHVWCPGNNTGSIVLSQENGTAPFSYNWSTGGATSSIGNLTAGTYTVTVDDAGSCTWDTTYTILEPQDIATQTDSTAVSCFGGSNGTATVTVTGGTPAYTYLWDAAAGSQTSQTAYGLSTGNYSVTVTDYRGCTASDNVTVTGPATALVTSISDTSHIGCKTYSNGTATVAATGGVVPYSYLWDAGAGSQTTAKAVSLSAGTYSVTVTDAGGCSSTSTVTIREPSGSLTLSVASTNITCNGAANGEMRALVSGGTTPYTYAWDDPLNQITQTAIALDVGAYSVNVSDANGCTVTGNGFITQPDELDVSAISTDVTCAGGTDGQAVALVSGGTPGYNYLWNPSGQTVSNAVNLGAAVYKVMVTDAKSCRDSAFVTIDSPEPVVFDSVVYSTECISGSNGFIRIYAQGGTGSLIYSIDNGANFYSNGGVFINLSAGNYPVLVRDDNACDEAYGNIVIASQSTDPSGIIISNNNTCVGTLKTLTPNGGATGTGGTWNWYGDAGCSSLLHTGNSYLINPATDTPYWLRAESGCDTSAIVTATVQVAESSVIPTGISKSDDNIAPGTNVTLTIDGGTLGDGASWKWYLNAGGTISAGADGSTLDVAPMTTAQYWARAEGTCNTTGMVTTTVTVSPLPSKPATPIGIDEQCQDSPDTDYTTPGAAGATSCIWYISPPEAGTISGTGTTGTVDWAADFFGNVQITVQGQNVSGTGPISDPLDVYIWKIPEETLFRKPNE